MRTTVFVLLLLGFPLVSRAAPVEQRFDLQIGGEPLHIPLEEPVRIRLEGDVITMAQTPDQLVITPGDKAGAARLILATDSRFAIWALGVDTPRAPLEPQALEAARKACPGLTANDEKLEAQVNDAACVAALAPLTRRFLERELRLRWNVAGLRAQLLLLQKALAPLPEGKGLTLGFIGAELMLRGTLPDTAALDRVRVALFDASVGPLRLDLSKLEVISR